MPASDAGTINFDFHGQFHERSGYSYVQSPYHGTVRIDPQSRDGNFLKLNGQIALPRVLGRQYGGAGGDMFVPIAEPMTWSFGGLANIWSNEEREGEKSLVFTLSRDISYNPPQWGFPYADFSREWYPSEVAGKRVVTLHFAGELSGMLRGERPRLTIIERVIGSEVVDYIGRSSNGQVYYSGSSVLSGAYRYSEAVVTPLPAAAWFFGASVLALVGVWRWGISRRAT